MEIGIDSFATIRPTNINPTKENSVTIMAELLERIQYDEEVELEIIYKLRLL